MLTIRLSRIGKKKQPTFRLIISEKHKDPWGDNLEFLGNYNPRTKTLTCQTERIKYWLEKGAQCSNTINNLLIKNGIITGSKKKVIKITKNRKTKLTAKQNLNKENADKEKTAAEVKEKSPVAEEKKEDTDNKDN